MHMHMHMHMSGRAPDAPSHHRDRVDLVGADVVEVPPRHRIALVPDDEALFMIPSRCWPRWECKEHNGQGWTAKVVDRVGRRFALRATVAFNHKGLPYDAASSLHCLDRTFRWSVCASTRTVLTLLAFWLLLLFFSSSHTYGIVE